MTTISHKITTKIKKLSPRRHVLTRDYAEEIINICDHMYYNDPTFNRNSPGEYSFIDSKARKWGLNGPVKINKHTYVYVISDHQYDFSGDLILYLPQRLEICSPADSLNLSGTCLRVRIP